jgi:hypothetical protein
VRLGCRSSHGGNRPARFAARGLHGSDTGGVVGSDVDCRVNPPDEHQHQLKVVITMEFAMRNLVSTKRPEFSYDVAAQFDDGIKYGVRNGPSHGPGQRPTDNGQRLGYVARFDPALHERCIWYATPDEGDADKLRWVGGFNTRREASMFLDALAVAKSSWWKTSQPAITTDDADG